MIYRQGDVLLFPIKEFPKNLRRKNLILAYGEATGHMHQFLDATQVSVFEDLQQQQFVEVIEDSDLVHDEHDTLRIPEGLYEVRQQREVDLTNEIRKVMD